MLGLAEYQGYAFPTLVSLSNANHEQGPRSLGLGCVSHPSMAQYTSWLEMRLSASSAPELTSDWLHRTKPEPSVKKKGQPEIQILRSYASLTPHLSVAFWLAGLASGLSIMQVLASGDGVGLEELCSGKRGDVRGGLEHG